MPGADTASRFPGTYALALVLAMELLATTGATRSVAQPRETVHERRPAEGSLARGLLSAPRWAVLGAGVAVAVAAGVLLVRRARRVPR